MTLDLRRLHYFVVAAEEGNFRRAALRLGINQSVISRRVRDIEDDLGADLFHRLPGRPARLTEVGHAFLGDIQKMFTHLDQAKTTAQAVANGKCGRLRVAASEDVMTNSLARIIKVHRLRWPDVYLDLLELPAVAQARALRSGRIDLGLTLPPVKDPAIICDPIWSEEWLAALSDNHPLACKDDLQTHDFCGQHVIVGHMESGPQCGRYALNMLKELRVTVHIAAEVEHLQTELVLVQAGLGIAFVSGALLDIDGIVFRRFAPAGNRIVVHAAWLDGNINGLVAQFLRVAQSVMATDLRHQRK